MTQAQRLRSAALAALPFVMAALLFATLYVRLHDRLPAEVATHFGAGGEADGFSSRGTMLWSALLPLLGLALMFAGIQAFGRVPTQARKVLFASAYGSAMLMGYLFVGVLVLHLDLADAAGVSLGWDRTALALLATAAAAALGWLLGGLGPEEPEPAPEEPGELPRLRLRREQSASWSRTVASTWLLAVVTGSFLLSAVLMAVLDLWGPALAMLLVGLAFLVFHSLRVTVDSRGVLVGSTRVPALRRRVALGRISRAYSREVSPLREFGGWGYRVVPGKRGLVMRGGEALALQLHEGKEYVITVDDSRTAAALVNTLLDRR